MIHPRRFFPPLFSVCLLLLTSIAFAPPATRPSAVPIVYLHGTPEEMGTEHGQQLGDVVQMLHEKYLKVFMGTTTHRLLAIGAARVFEQKFSPDHLAEQTGISQDDTVLAQCFLDLTPMSACSTVTLPSSAAPDHVARFGRNLDFPSLNVADEHTVVFIRAGGHGLHAFASVGWPGMIGVLSGMNDSGLTLANMEVKRKPRLPSAMPYALLYRTVLEKCGTVDEAIDLLSRTPRQTANNLMLMDAAGARAVVEIQPDAIAVRRGVDSSALISTNHQRDQDAATPGRCKRYDCLLRESAAQFGGVDLPVLEKMLADASQGNSTLQTMVFEPSERVMYLSAGKNAARGSFERIDLKEAFGQTAGIAAK